MKSTEERKKLLRTHADVERVRRSVDPCSNVSIKKKMSDLIHRIHIFLQTVINHHYVQLVEW